jgi:hypothetical protein
MLTVRCRSEVAGRVCVRVAGARARVRAFDHHKAVGMTRFESEGVKLPVEGSDLFTGGCDEGVDMEVIRHISIEQKVGKASKTRGFEVHYLKDRTLRQVYCYNL